MKRKCNGCICPTPELSFDTRELLLSRIDKCRNRMVRMFGNRNDNKQLYSGIRFENDETVLARISSAYKEQEITLSNRNKILIDALYDCMSADYYYTFEKDYGEEENASD